MNEANLQYEVGQPYIYQPALCVIQCQRQRTSIGSLCSWKASILDAGTVYKIYMINNYTKSCHLFLKYIYKPMILVHAKSMIWLHSCFC
jgi:hypothetical protein